MVAIVAYFVLDAVVESQFQGLQFNSGGSKENLLCVPEQKTKESNLPHLL